MSGYPETLLNGGPHHSAARSEGGTITLRPRGDSATSLLNFQAVVAPAQHAEEVGDIAVVSWSQSEGIFDRLVIRVL